MPGELSILLDANNAAGYARHNGLLPQDCAAEVRELVGGVSNVVLLVRPAATNVSPFVIKQARPQLRVQEEWHCPVERIWTEIDMLQTLGETLADLPTAGDLRLRVPDLIFKDRDNFTFAMSAVDPAVPTWKDVLLAGSTALAPAVAAGTMLGMTHGRTWQNADVAAHFADSQYFELLRVDPYYRHVQRKFPDLETPLQSLIDSLAANRNCLVHGDFSPKNLLLTANELVLLDFEVGHFGDPAFDVGFFLSHLVLKWLRSEQHSNSAAILRAASSAYRQALAPQLDPLEWSSLRMRSLRNLGGCLLARVDGKSCVDYLSTAQQQQARQLGRACLTAPQIPAELAAWLDL